MTQPTTLVLVRHGRTPANADGILAGRSAGVDLDDVGRTQVRAVGERLAPVPLAGIVASPLERTMATAHALVAHQAAQSPVTLHEEPDLLEVDYGDWTGRALRELAEEPLWRVVQDHPSGVTFPGGEALTAMASRSIAAIRRWNRHFEGDVYAAVSHGDVIKAIVADALGLHLDQFQRIQIEPASVTVIRYTERRPFVVRLNDVGGEVGSLIPSRPADSDAPVGGGA